MRRQRRQLRLYLVLAAALAVAELGIHRYDKIFPHPLPVEEKLDANGALLVKRVPSGVQLGRTVGDAIQRLGKATQTDIAVNWEAVAAAGAHRRAGVFLDVGGMTLEQAITAILLQSAGSGRAVSLVVRPSGGTVVVTSSANLEPYRVRLRYDVQELLPPPLTAASSGVEIAERRRAAGDLIVAVRAECGLGGQPDGSDAEGIDELGGSLYVTATPGAHVRVNTLLDRWSRRVALWHFARDGAVCAAAAMLAVVGLHVLGATLLRINGRAAARREALRAGLCKVCGYDLRATPDRCPECGTETPGANPLVEIA